MDPFTVAAIGGAVGGATGKLIERACDLGGRWLATYFKDHLPKAQAAARENALDFLGDLASRVGAIEEAVEGAPDAKGQIEDALADPDFAALLKDAIIGSSRTDSEEKHKLLARVVSERLLAGEESLVALAGNVACESILHLSSKHLRSLGVMTLVYGTRPQPFPPDIPPDSFHDWWVGWLRLRLSPMMPVGVMRQIDYSHLVSVSCITYDYVSTRKLEKMLFPPGDSVLKWDYGKFVGDTDVGKELSELWESGMNRAIPTTVGRLVGVYVGDLLGGRETRVSWD